MTQATAFAPTSLLLNGAPGSPYSRKMVALLRYRRIAYRLVLSVAGVPGLAPAKPPLLPTFYLPGEDGTLQAVTDSTPLIRRFEAEFAGRAVVPADPALALIDALLEDFGDEWLTKAMFHYRWSYPADINKASRLLACWRGGPHDDESLEATAAMVSGRQIPRLRYVGSTPDTAAVIEAGYRRVLLALEDHFRVHRFLMGGRPGASDFCTPPSTASTWVQQAFAYQGKCLAWLRRDHQALSSEARQRANAALAGSGCRALFSGAQA